MTPAGPTNPSTLQKASSGQLGRLDWRRLLMEDVRAGAAPGFVLAAILVGAFVLELNTGGPMVWGLSQSSLTEGRWATLASHAFAHAGIWHLWANCSALIGLTIAARRMLGRGVAGWARYLMLLMVSGAASAVAFLALHPTDGVPMVGASGAICGLWGFVVRCDLETGRVRSLISSAVERGVRTFIVNNAILFGLLFVLVRLSGGAGGLAWESHLGGFLLGLLIAPWIVVLPTLLEPAATS